MINSDKHHDNLLNQHLKLEDDAENWYKAYINGFDIKTDWFEHKYFVNKWHENTDWEANPNDISHDCTNAILAFREFNLKFKRMYRQTSRFVTLSYFTWEDGENIASVTESVEDYNDKLFERGIRKS